MRKRTVSVAVASLILFNGCAANNAFMDNAGKIGGTAIGAGIGAVIGKELGGDVGMLVGAGIGAGIGYLIGNEIDTRRENLAKLAKEENVEIVSQNIVQNNNQVVAKNVKDETTKGNIIGDSFTVFSNEQQFGLNSSNLNPKAEQLFNKIASEYKNSDKKI